MGLGEQGTSQHSLKHVLFIPWKDWETLIIPFGFEEQITTLVDRMQRESSKGEMCHIAEVPLGSPWWAESSHTTSLPRALCGPCHMDLSYGRSGGELHPCASAYWPHWLACLHGTAPFPEWRVGPGLYVGVC